MSQIESFSVSPLALVIPAYLYQQYQNDPALPAFVSAFNSIAQGYLNWFNQNPLGLYTSPGISGPLLDWIAAGVYGLDRPVLASQTSEESAGYDSSTYNTVPYNFLSYSASGTSQQATDDIFKRSMTWNLYKGDGQYFTIQWLKNRVARFLHGPNGTDCAVLDYQPSVTISGKTFTVTDFANSNYTALQLCYQAYFLPFPFQYQLAFATVNFTNNSGALHLSQALYYPTNATGLAPGSVWYSAGAIGIVPGVTPNPTAPALMFATTDPNTLLSLGGGNLPTTNPGINGQLWNNGGFVDIAT